MNVILFSEKDIFVSDKEKSLWIFYKNDERYLHIKKILKLSIGDYFKAGFINGSLGIAKINSFSKNEITFLFDKTNKSQSLAPINLILGFPRPIQLKRILRDVASLGCSEIFLCATELGESSYLNSSLSKEDKIKKYLLDGISQAGQNILPKFSFYSSVEKCLKFIGTKFLKENKPETFLKILLDIDETAENLAATDFSKSKEVFLAIGSERGWTENERNLFKNYKFIKKSMGSRILRTETATTAALAISLSKMQI